PRVAEVLPHDPARALVILTIGGYERLDDGLVAAHWRVGGEPILERRPARNTMRAREGMLHVPQRRRRRCARHAAREPRARVRLASTERLQPLPCFLLETVEGRARRDLPGHGPSSRTPAVR